MSRWDPSSMYDYEQYSDGQSPSSNGSHDTEYPPQFRNTRAIESNVTILKTDRPSAFHDSKSKSQHKKHKYESSATDKKSSGGSSKTSSSRHTRPEKSHSLSSHQQSQSGGLSSSNSSTALLSSVVSAVTSIDARAIIQAKRSASELSLKKSSSTGSKHKPPSPQTQQQQSGDSRKRHHKKLEKSELSKLSTSTSTEKKLRRSNEGDELRHNIKEDDDSSLPAIASQALDENEGEIEDVTDDISSNAVDQMALAGVASNRWLDAEDEEAIIQDSVKAPESERGGGASRIGSYRGTGMGTPHQMVPSERLATKGGGTLSERLRRSPQASDEENVDADGDGGAGAAAELSDDEESDVELPPPKPFYYPAIQGCRSVEEFTCLNRIEEGTYGVVYRAEDKKTKEIVALKRLKMEKERDGFPITSLREINTLMKAQHENIVTLREIVVGSNMDKIFLVMEYVEHDLKSLMETMKQPFHVGEVKCLLLQLLKATAHLHDNWILHRDLKTSNLLLSHRGILKVGDFGLAREYGSPLKGYTEVVVTLWYRAPELLLGTKKYTTPIDLWSVGCIFGELLLLKPLFQGKSEVEQVNILFRELGKPSETIWPGVSEFPMMKKVTFPDMPYNQLRKRFGGALSDRGFELLNKFLTYDPKRRINAEKALDHPYFDETPRAIDPSMFPTWPAKSEGGVHRRVASPKPPPGHQIRRPDGQMAAAAEEDAFGFHMSAATHGVSSFGHGFNLNVGSFVQRR